MSSYFIHGDQSLNQIECQCLWPLTTVSLITSLNNSREENSLPSLPGIPSRPSRPCIISIFKNYMIEIHSCMGWWDGLPCGKKNQCQSPESKRIIKDYIPSETGMLEQRVRPQHSRRAATSGPPLGGWLVIKWLIPICWAIMKTMYRCSQTFNWMLPMTISKRMR